MPVTLRNTDILFNDNTTQNTAASPFPSSITALGAILPLIRTDTVPDDSTYNDYSVIGSTAAGSTLRYDYPFAVATKTLEMPNLSELNNYYTGLLTFDTSVGTAPPGTWRCITRDHLTQVPGGGYGAPNTARRGPGLWQRIA
jgi:hypothetical protein